MKLNPLFLFTAAIFFTAPLSFSVSAHALTGYENATDDLKEEIAKLKRIPVSSCPANYQKIYSNKTLRIGFFIGYGNFKKEILDPAEAKAITNALTMPCQKNIEACGFNIVGRSRNHVSLERILRGKKVQIEVRNSALSDYGPTNRMNRAQQREQSLETRRAFHDAILDSDVVFYLGHSRRGSGLGFYRNNIIKDAFNIVFKARLQETLHTLSRTERLKVLGLFACETDRHYRTDVERANPRVDLILSTVEISEPIQMAFGALNAILLQQCDPQLKESLVAAKDPTVYEDAVRTQHDWMEYHRR